jgi:hypothetical protein
MLLYSLLRKKEDLEPLHARLMKCENTLEAFATGLR